MKHGTNLIRATAAAAIEASRWMGLGDEVSLMENATGQMKFALDKLKLSGTIRVGDRSGPLTDGVKLGNGLGDLAIKSVEGVTATSLGGSNSLSLIAATVDAEFLPIPFGMYMQKVVVPPWASGTVDLHASTTNILEQLAKQKQVAIHELRIVILDRPRNEKILDEIRSVGARVTLIADGDVAVSLAILAGKSSVDVLLGSGGAREALFTATAARAVPNSFYGRFLIRTREEEHALLASGLESEDLKNGYLAEQLAPGSAILSATAITDCPPLNGIHLSSSRVSTESYLFRGDTGTIRKVISSHRLADSALGNVVILPDLDHESSRW